MERKYLLSKNGNDYKANLHCHTTLSDGGDTPQEIKQMYTEKGYSIVAFTDHDVFIPHPELCDESFLALNGFEMEIYDTHLSGENIAELKKDKAMRTTHINFIALDDKIELQPLFHREHYFIGNAKQAKCLVKFDESLPDFERKYTPECINYIFKTCKEKGFFVTYNHPRWSLENYPIYSKYEGMNAFEIMNGGSVVNGFFENDFQIYDDLLCQGKQIFTIAGDDNHGISQSFICWTVIRAEELSYNAVSKALSQGNFYATTGPEFKELYVENGRLFVTASDVKNIIFTTAIRHRGNVFDKDGKPVNKGSFEIDKRDKYVRATLVGFDGTVAYSNPYFVD